MIINPTKTSHPIERMIRQCNLKGRIVLSCPKEKQEVKNILQSIFEVLIPTNFEHNITIYLNEFFFGPKQNRTQHKSNKMKTAQTNTRKNQGNKLQGRKAKGKILQNYALFQEKAANSTNTRRNKIRNQDINKGTRELIFSDARKSSKFLMRGQPVRCSVTLASHKTKRKTLPNINFTSNLFNLQEPNPIWQRIRGINSFNSSPTIRLNCTVDYLIREDPIQSQHQSFDFCKLRRETRKR